MTGADIAQSRLGYTGRGVHVAVIDSGIDYDHPDLGGCFGPGCRVTNGYDFVGDDYDEEESDPTWQPVPHPDADPDDCVGHGTHVAGIIGANGGVRGVAPDVTFGAYRVFGCTGATSDRRDARRDGARLPRRRRRAQHEHRRERATAGRRDRSRRLRRAWSARASSSWPPPATTACRASTRPARPGVGQGRDRRRFGRQPQAVRPAFTISPDDRGVIYIAGIGSRAGPVRRHARDRAHRDRRPRRTTPALRCRRAALDRQGRARPPRHLHFLVKATNVAAAGAGGLVVYSNDEHVLRHAGRARASRSRSSTSPGRTAS